MNQRPLLSSGASRRSLARFGVVGVCAGFSMGLGLAGCGGDDGGGDPPPTGTPLAVEGAQLRDESGRAVLLRGINARVQGVFDVTFDDIEGDTRLPLEDIPALTAADCSRMRALGLNLLRLPINWSGIEPQRDVYDEAYLQNVDAAIECAASAGVLVVVDLHQDAYSKEIGEDGAPLWAIVPEPETLLGGPLTDLGERRTSAQVLRAFDSFFALGDPAGLQAEFIDMLTMVATRWGQHPGVAGFEIFNEPQAAAEELYAFEEKAAQALRTAAPGKLVFFEPPTIRNLTDAQPLSSAAWPVPGSVYSPHIYTLIFNGGPDGLDNLVAEDLRPSVRGARYEADAFATPLFIGEFGLGPGGTNADLWMETQASLHDEYFAADAFWLWKEQSQASWGLHEWDGSSWSERPQVVRWMSRFHPERMAGDPVSLAYDPATETLRLELEARNGVTGPTTIYVPERHADAFAIRCDGAAVTATRAPATGLVEVDCHGVIEAGPQ